MTVGCERGLTLIELMVALAVGAIVLLTVQGVFLNASELREAQRQEGTRYHRSRVLVDRLERELGSVLFSSSHPGARFILLDGREPQLELSTFASLPRAAGQATGPAMVRYRWRLADDGEGLELMRHERSLQQSDWRGEEQRMMGGIDDLLVRCFDGTSWQTRWDSGEQGRLPQLLEISFSVGGEKQTPFRTTLEISGASGS